MSSKSTTPRGLRETQAPPNHGDVWTYDEPSDLWKPKPGGGVPSEFGIGANVDNYNIPLSNGVFFTVPLAPAIGNITHYILSGIGINGTNDGLVIQTKGRYYVSGFVSIAQHATLYLAGSFVIVVTPGLHFSNEIGCGGTIIPASLIANSPGKYFGATIDDYDVGDVIQVQAYVEGANSTLADCNVCIQYVGLASF